MQRKRAMLYNDAIETLENLVNDAHRDGDKMVEFAARSLLVKIMRSNVRAFLNHTPRLQDGLTKEEIAILRQPFDIGDCSRKIQAIKLYRERTKQGLKESKEAIEAWMRKHLGYESFPCTPYCC